MTEAQMIAVAKAMFERQDREYQAHLDWDHLLFRAKLSWLTLAYHALLAMEKSK